MSSTAFAEASALHPIRPGHWRAEVTADWGQGRTAFGGLVAVFALRACGELVGADRPLRSFTMDFVTPAEVGEVQVIARVLHQGKATSHLEARVMQGERVCALVMAIFAVPRATGIHVASASAPVAEGPEGRVELPFLEGLTPAFTKKFVYRWGDHPIPSSGADRPGAGGWVRPREGDADPLTQVAMLDAWPAPVLALTHAPTPASTVLWLVQVHTPLRTHPGSAWWRFESEVEGASDGCADTTQRLWAPDGQLALVGRQLVAEFSRLPPPR